MPTKNKKIKKTGQGYKLGLNRDKLAQAYYRFGSVRKVAEKFGCTISTARYHLVQAGAIKPRRR